MSLFSHEAPSPSLEYSYEKEDFELKVGERAVQFTVLTPYEGVTQQEVLLLLPGFVAKRRMHEPLAREATRHGYRSIIVAHDAGGPAARREVTELLGELSEGDYSDVVFDGIRGGELVPTAHSLGGGRAVASIEELRTQGVYLNKLILEAAACFGGVAPHRAPRSIGGEIHYLMTHGLWDEFHVARDALAYITASGPLALADEIAYAMRHNAAAHTTHLIEAGVAVAAISHHDDLLINAETANAGLRRAGVDTIIDIDAPYTGHNVQLYAPQQALSAIQKALHSMKAPVLSR